jgi:hypothetical protein
MKLIAMNVQLKNDCSELSERPQNVDIEKGEFSVNFEEEFLKKKMLQLAEFCCEHGGKTLFYENYFLNPVLKNTYLILY